MNNNRLPFIITTVVGTLIILSTAYIGYTMVKMANANSASRPDIAYVDVTSEGFIPADIQITPGMTVTWRNTTNVPHQVASNPYPSRVDLPGLYSPAYMQPSSEYSYTFASTGTFGYHDYLNPATVGKVTVVNDNN